MDAAILIALAEPNRLRIVEFLAAAPRAVGEIATELGLRQPQVTKHLQTLERAGLVRVHPLGQRRIYSLRRGPLAALASWAQAVAADHPSERALERYERAVAAETRRLAVDRSPREARIRRTVAAPPQEVWRAWTEAAWVRRWWSPQHFEVAECTVRAADGGQLAIVLAEGDGTRHRAAGQFLRLEPFRVLVFELSPQDPDGRPLFTVRHTVRLTPAGDRTVVALRVTARDPAGNAAPALAGLRIGWEQTLDKLAALFD